MFQDVLVIIKKNKVFQLTAPSFELEDIIFPTANCNGIMNRMHTIDPIKELIPSFK